MSIKTTVETLRLRLPTGKANPRSVRLRCVRLYRTSRNPRTAWKSSSKGFDGILHQNSRTLEPSSRPPFFAESQSGHPGVTIANAEVESLHRERIYDLSSRLLLRKR